MSAPEEITVTANGMRFAALQWQPAPPADTATPHDAAPLALLLHGYPDTAWSWRHLGPFLAHRGWRVVAPFTRGYAPTDLAPDDSYLVKDLAADALELHTALNGDDRAALIGHDWGAVATWAVTAREPDRFARYVALAVPPPNALLTPFTRIDTVSVGLRQLRMSWYMLFNQLPGVAERSLDRLIPSLWRTWSPGYDADEDAARVLRALDTPARRRAALRYYRDNLQRGALKTFTLRAGAPALYLHGADDGCMQAAIAETHPETLPPGTRFEVVPGVGHFMQLEDPDRINALIGDWLS